MLRKDVIVEDLDLTIIDPDELVVCSNGDHRPIRKMDTVLGAAAPEDAIQDRLHGPDMQPSYGIRRKHGDYLRVRTI